MTRTVAEKIQQAEPSDPKTAAMAEQVRARFLQLVAMQKGDAIGEEEVYREFLEEWRNLA